MKEKGYTVKQAYEDTVQGAYEQRDLLTRVRGLIARLAGVKTAKELDDATVVVLGELRTRITAILGR